MSDLRNHQLARDTGQVEAEHKARTAMYESLRDAWTQAATALQKLCDYRFFSCHLELGPSGSPPQAFHCKNELLGPNKIWHCVIHHSQSWHIRKPPYKSDKRCQYWQLTFVHGKVGMEGKKKIRQQRNVNEQKTFIRSSLPGARAPQKAGHPLPRKHL